MDVSTEQRRARLVRLHHLDGGADGATQAADDVVALHATDPATVYLSLLARCARLTIGDVAKVLYDERALVRMLAMRRTLFVVPHDRVPVVHWASSVDIAAQQRKRLLAQLRTLPTDPPLPVDLEAWLESLEQSVEGAVARRGTATAAQLASDEPRLRTALLPTTDKKWDVRRNITSQVLVLMAAQGRLVRSEPRGSWTSRAHTWEPASRWWPEGIERPADAKARLVERYLRRFGPATEADVQWWTGWTLGTTRKALAALDTVDVGCGLMLADEPVDADVSSGGAALLPALDATPMGWKRRDWFLPEHWQPLYDRNGNVGPTVWWRGEVVGGWAVRADGRVVTRLVVDRGHEAARAVADAVAALEPRLEGKAVVPSFPTPLETELRKG